MERRAPAARPWVKRVPHKGPDPLGRLGALVPLQTTKSNRSYCTDREGSRADSRLSRLKETDNSPKRKRPQTGKKRNPKRTTTTPTDQDHFRPTRTNQVDEGSAPKPPPLAAAEAREGTSDPRFARKTKRKQTNPFNSPLLTNPIAGTARRAVRLHK